MSLLKHASAALAATVLSSAAALAADAGPVTVVTVPTLPPMTEEAPGWGGFFIGTYGSLAIEPGYGIVWYNLGGQAGYNFDLGHLVLGVVARAGTFIQSGFGPHLEAAVRVGFPTERVLIYGFAGAGSYPTSCCFYIDVGAGVEMRLGERVSLFGEFHYDYFPAVPPPPLDFRLDFGLNFHFGD